MSEVAAAALDGFFLPGLDPADVADWAETPLAGLDTVVRHPLLDGEATALVWGRLRAARVVRLSGAPLGDTAPTLAEAAARLVSAAREEPWRAAIAAQFGLSPDMLDHVLENMARGWTARAFSGLVAAEFGEANVVTRFAEDPSRPGVLHRPVAEDVIFHVLAGNVPGVGVTALARALLVGSSAFARAARSGSLLPALFARCLAATDPALAACVATTWWPGGDADAERALLVRARLVVVYGGAEAVSAIRARARAETRVVVHGPGVSVGMVSADALASERVDRTAEAAALALATFDQRGCTSPVAFLVERADAASTGTFCEALGRRLTELSRAMPPGPPHPPEAARRRQVIEAAEMRAARSDGGSSAPGPPIEGPGFCLIPTFRLEPSDFCVGRTVQVLEVADLEDAAEQLDPLAGALQTVGYAGNPAGIDRIADRLAALGVSRITTLDAMPWPPPAWRHDGAHPLRELVRWSDLERA
ncbi:MAG TPA: acyl-CoA reductase [Longimicrobiales bacterium]|nr:acyl-CoA reductase [Longimicrobiales bacterium]